MVHCALFNTALYILARTWITMITRIDLLFLHGCVLNSPWCPKLMLRCGILSTNCVNLSRCWSACLQGRRIGEKNSRVFRRIWTYDLAHIRQMIYQWVGCQNMNLFSKGHTCKNNFQNSCSNNSKGKPIFKMIKKLSHRVWKINHTFVDTVVCHPRRYIQHVWGLF